MLTSAFVIVTHLFHYENIFFIKQTNNAHKVLMLKKQKKNLCIYMSAYNIYFVLSSQKFFMRTNFTHFSFHVITYFCNSCLFLSSDEFILLLYVDIAVGVLIKNEKILLIITAKFQAINISCGYYVNYIRNYIVICKLRFIINKIVYSFFMLLS